MARARHYLAKKLTRREGSAVRSAHFSASQAVLEKSSFLGGAAWRVCATSWLRNCPAGRVGRS